MSDFFHFRYIVFYAKLRILESFAPLSFTWDASKHFQLFSHVVSSPVPLFKHHYTALAFVMPCLDKALLFHCQGEPEPEV